VLHVRMTQKKYHRIDLWGEIKMKESHGFGALPWIVFEWISLGSGSQMTTVSAVHDVVK